MNVVFLSPAFPPTAPAFCAALAKEGVTVLGIGDEHLTAEQQRACGLTDYAFEPRMSEHQPLRAAAEALRQKYGRIDRIDSNGEHWLAASGSNVATTPPTPVDVRGDATGTTPRS